MLSLQERIRNRFNEIIAASEEERNFYNVLNIIENGENGGEVPKEIDCRLFLMDKLCVLIDKYFRLARRKSLKERETLVGYKQEFDTYYKKIQEWHQLDDVNEFYNQFKRSFIVNLT